MTELEDLLERDLHTTQINPQHLNQMTGRNVEQKLLRLLLRSSLLLFRDLLESLYYLSCVNRPFLFGRDLWKDSIDRY